MAGKTTDPIFNEPQKVEISGRTFDIRELSYRSARGSVLAIHDLVLAFKKANPEMKLSELDSGDKLVDALVNSLRDMIEETAEILERLVCESAGIEQEALEKMPFSMYVELVGHVARAQAPVVQAFLSLDGALRELWGNRQIRGGNGPAPAPKPTPPKRKSSPASRVSASAPKKRAG